MTEFDPRRARGKRPLPLWVDAFLRDTMALEINEIGAFNLILFAMWARPTCDVDDDDRKLAQICRVSTRLWNSRIRPALEPFFKVRYGVWISKKLREQARYTERQVTQQRCRKTGEKEANLLKDIEWHQTTDSTADSAAEDTTAPTYPITQLPNYPIVVE